MTNLSAKPRWHAAAVGAVFALGLGWSSEAHAQGWLGDPRLAEGPGIRTGDLELHPGIGGEVGYDSNWFLRSNASGANVINGAPSLPPADAAVFRITPSFYVSTTRGSDAGTGTRIDPRFVTFQGGVSATGRFFIGKEFTDQHSVSLNADARATFNQGHPIGATIFGGYARAIQPQVFSDPNLSFNRDDLRAGANLLLVPGGGTLDFQAGYAINASLYEETNGVPFSTITHEINVKDRWKFRPRTALFSEASLLFINYPNAPRSTFLLNDATPLRTRGGVTGLVTNWLGTTVAAGYSATFFQNPELATTRQFDSFNAQVEGIFYLGGGGVRAADSPGDATLLLSSFTVGFQRDFQRSVLGNFYGSNRGYLGVEYWFGNRVVINSRVTGELLEYPAVFFNGVAPTPGVGSVGDFTNIRLTGNLFAEYRFTPSIGLNTTITYIQQFSDTQLPAGLLPGTQTQGVFDQNYGRLQAFLGFRYFL